MSKKASASSKTTSTKGKTAVKVAPAATAAPAVTPAPKPVAARKTAVKVAAAPAKAVVATKAVKTPARKSAPVKTAAPAKPAAPAKAVKAVKAVKSVKAVKAPAATPAPTPAPTKAPQPTVRATKGAGPVALARPAKKTVPAPAPARNSVPIFQIYFQPEQLAGLDPDLTPLDNSASKDPLHEFVVFERLYKQDLLRRTPLWGALSWRFGTKTEMSGADLRRTLAEHPGFDLYYCNPFPEHEALYVNSWQQGVPSHPAFMELSTAVFKAAGLDLAELAAIQPSAGVSTCNYFIGSPAFWSAYLPWVRGVLDRARANLPAAVLKLLDSPLSDPKNRHAGSSYWPFIVERLLPLFLKTAGADLKTHKIALPGVEKRLNTHVQRLREMKDVAHRTKSRWLYACWLNYRNLYLLQTAGPDWCKRFLPLISTTELEFR